ncbi:MAG TPA: M48 family metallopeptidase [Blastocatellia bacterium]|nr:M48 family metallopeptidase [Blastocatellia bacterium]
MKTTLLKRMTIFVLAAMIAAPTTLFAGDKKPTNDKKPTDQPAASAPVPKGELKDDENPMLIGKRNINHGILPNFYSLEKEVKLGQQLAAQLDREAKFIDDPVIAEYVNRVGQNLVLHSDAKVPFTIKVVDSDEVNAFALPGGFFYVNKGLILAADNEAEIAGVMAHEIAHVAARHGVEQASKAQLVNWASIGLIFVGGPIGAIAYNAASFGVPLAFLKFTRGAETEADKLGAEYAWAAGYDSNSLVTFFEKLEKKEKDKPGTLGKLFRSHPPTPDRITNVRALVARFPDRDEYTVNTSDFDKVKARLLALTNSKIVDGSGRDTGPKRPTLKRRKDDDPASTTTTPSEEQPQDRPTLKRRDTDGKPADTPPPTPTKPPEKKP